MPPKPRGLHLPSAATKPRILPRKPHLSKLHLDSTVLAQQANSPLAGINAPFVPPVAPQIPRRRRPAFSPGGFGLTSSSVPRAPDVRGLGRPITRTAEQEAEARAATVAEIARRDQVIANDELALEGKQKDEGEAEACYIVSVALLADNNISLSLASICRKPCPPASLCPCPPVLTIGGPLHGFRRTSTTVALLR